MDILLYLEKRSVICIINLKMKKKSYSTPFGEYFRYLDKADKEVKDSKEYGSMLILALVEELGEMARA